MIRLSRKHLFHAAAAGAAFALCLAPVAAFAQDPNAAQAPAQGAAPDAAAKPAKHHSKLKGAVVGGAGGAVVGGKKGAAVGAAAGTLYQHHKNKKEAKQQQ
ncbi:MAG: hypothetical protein NVS2B9_18380 [Myxococcales bacterium]